MSVEHLEKIPRDNSMNDYITDYFASNITDYFASNSRSLILKILPLIQILLILQKLILLPLLLLQLIILMINSSTDTTINTNLLTSHTDPNKATHTTIASSPNTTNFP